MASWKSTIAILGSLLCTGIVAVAFLPSGKTVCVMERGNIRTVAHGLEAYKAKHGVYPNLSNFPSMVSAESPLVTEDFIPLQLSTTDRWGRPFKGHSSPIGYRLESLPDPNNQNDPEEHVIVGGNPNQPLYSGGVASSPH